MVLHALRLAPSDPFLQMLADAPEDDEIRTADEKALVKEARQQLRHGQGRSLEDIRRELLSE
jgi:hypothetical protein